MKILTLESQNFAKINLYKNWEYLHIQNRPETTMSKKSSRNKKMVRMAQKSKKQSMNDDLAKIQEDDRFSFILKDKRFQSTSQNKQKVKIDSRFKDLLTNEDFNPVNKINKYGKKIKKDKNTMEKFYYMED